MTRLVADLQILGLSDAAGFSLERTHTDLGKLADETAREFAGLLEGAGGRLQTRLESATAWADQVRVGQILANLMSNALKYIPHGGLIRVEPSPTGRGRPSSWPPAWIPMAAQVSRFQVGIPGCGHRSQCLLTDSNGQNSPAQVHKRYIAGLPEVNR